MLKFCSALAEIFRKICKFLLSRHKSYRNSLCNSGVSGIIVIIAQNIAKILQFNICKSELRYSNPFQNASVLNEGHFANFE